MDRRIDRGQVTRQRLVESGTRLFTEHGYEATSIEMVLHDTGVSRGALYHHFDGKGSLFAAVLEATEARVAAVVASAAGAAGADPLGVLRAGCDAWLRLAASDAAVRRIVLTDAPTVVGWSAWRAIDDRYALGLLKAGLSAAAAAAGSVRRESIDVAAHLLLATLIEAALLIARSDDPAATIALTQTTIGTILGALLT
jgi:AcrR family transcriptional regulator